MYSPRQPLQNHPSGHSEGGRRRGRQRKCWVDSIKEWTFLPKPELLTMSLLHKDWKDICWVVPRVSPTTRAVKGLNWTEVITSETDSEVTKQALCQTQSIFYSRLNDLIAVGLQCIYFNAIISDIYCWLLKSCQTDFLSLPPPPHTHTPSKIVLIFVRFVAISV